MTTPTRKLSLASTLLWLGSLAVVPAQNGAALEVTLNGRATGQPTLTWPAYDTNYAFTVQSRDTLFGGLWLNAPGTAPWPTALNTWMDPRSMSQAARFYRVLRVDAAQRGRLLGNVTLGAFPLGTLLLYAGQLGLPFTPQYGVNYYRLTYETIDPLGGRTIATGLLCLPSGNPNPLRLVSYQHGTLIERNSAPSYASSSTETLLGIFMASAGYAVALPDYLGLGGSPGFHPYHHAVSEATAAIDMLRATRLYCASHGIVLTNRLFLTGYSQGGHSTMALHRELERYHTAEFTVTASAPMAGAYDLSGVTTADFLSNRIMPNPYYFAFLLAAYQDVYRLTNSLADLLVTPYDTQLPPLLDGNHGSGEINDLMPQVPAQILKPEVLDAFRNDPNHPLRLALCENDVYDWRPVAPTRLWHCQGDQDVAFANSQTATNRFHELGNTTILLVNPIPSADHGACSQPSLLQAKAWFDSFP